MKKSIKFSPMLNKAATYNPNAESIAKAESSKAGCLFDTAKGAIDEGNPELYYEVDPICSDVKKEQESNHGFAVKLNKKSFETAPDIQDRSGKSKNGKMASGPGGGLYSNSDPVPKPSRLTKGRVKKLS